MVDFRRVGASLPLFDERTQAYGAGLPVDRIWGFLDGTDLAISRPTHNQREAYSGHKHRHVLKFQGVTTPDGILVQMFGPVEGCRHDATLLADSHLVEQLRAFMTAHFGPAIADWYFLYADKGYGITDVIQTPIRGVEAQNPAAVAANRLMSGVRIAVEHSFRKFKSLWAFQNYYMDCKLELSAVGRFYIVCVLLTNVHTTLYESQVGRAYHCAPPSLHEYLHGIFNPARNAATFALYVPTYPIGALGAAVPDIADYDVGRPVALHERAAEV
jgi:nuclease HARBI1